MRNRHIQMILSANEYYKGGIDGAIGPKSMKAVVDVEKDHADKYDFNPAKGTQKRRLIAAAQACLLHMGYDPGDIDGYMGVNTDEALNRFLYKQVHGKEEVIRRTAMPSAPGSKKIPTQAEVTKYYGRPGSDIRSKLVTIELPFKLRIDWKLSQKKGRRKR